jgi:hypothetical protein
MVQEYRLERHVWEMQLEEAAIGYATEEAEFREKYPPPMFKDRLIASRRPEPPEVVSWPSPTSSSEVA